LSHDLTAIRHAAFVPQFRKFSAEKIDIQLKACFALLLRLRAALLLPQAKQSKLHTMVEIDHQKSYGGT
jgi:hypothetical protein